MNVSAVRPVMREHSTSVLVAALHGLSQRQQVIAENIANVETPNFRAGRVDFETALADAVDSGAAPTGEVLFERAQDPTRLNGNNVSLDVETAAGIETNLRYQLTVNALNSKFQMLRSVVRS